METFINNTRQQQVELKELVADSQELRRFIDEALQAAEKNQPELVRLTESSTRRLVRPKTMVRSGS